MRPISLLALLALFVAPGLGHAQFAVYDAANHAKNTITALQTFFTAVESVIQTEQGIVNLTVVEDLIVAEGIAEDLAALADIVAQAEGLSYDVHELLRQIDALFDLNTAPDTRWGLEHRLLEIQQVKYQSYRYAARVQTLMVTALRTVEHLGRLIDSIGAFFGNVASQQRLAETSSTISKTLANLDAQTTAFNRAQTVDKLSEALVIESLNRINRARIADWPSF